MARTSSTNCETCSEVAGNSEVGLGFVMVVFRLGIAPRRITRGVVPDLLQLRAARAKCENERAQNESNCISSKPRICRMQTQITQQRLRELFEYDHQSGRLIWRDQTGARKLRSTEPSAAGGYTGHRIGGKTYQAHRLIWMYLHGSWPCGDIDHIDGNRRNNRADNLRAVSRSVNLQNLKKARSDNNTGLLGVKRNKMRFMARIRAGGGKQIYLGNFKTAKEAHEAYLTAKRRLHEGCTI